MSLLFRFIKAPSFQISSIILSMLLITGILTWEYQKHVYPEPHQEILKVDKKVHRFASIVDVGLHINNFPTFSFHENKFVMNAAVWFRFPAGAESLDTVKNFGFENGTILERSKPFIKLIGHNVVVSYQVKVAFKTYLEYRHFPIGDHRMNIVLHNKNVTPFEVTFLADDNNFELSDNLLIHRWIPASIGAQAGYIKSQLNKADTNLELRYPVVAFSIDFANNSIRDLITLFFPMFVIFFIGFFSLMTDVRDTFRFALITTSVPILALYNMVINAITPTVGKK